MQLKSLLSIVALAAVTPLSAQTTVPTEAPICTDRPTKSNFACTVPKGLVQIEADAFNWLTNSAGGVRTDQLLFTNPTFKYGLSGSSDIQLNWVPFTRIRNRETVGKVSTQSGIGDVTVRFK